MKELVVHAPSNIAFLKYWGKQDVTEQWPYNNSLSMTLNNSKTVSHVRLAANLQDKVEITGASEKASEKVYRHLDYLRQFVDHSPALDIKSQNTFPIACGIASSASGLAAITLGAISFWTRSEGWGDLERFGFSRERLASLSRMGSGSSCRSFHGGYVEWTKGTSPSTQGVAPIFGSDHWELADIVVVLSREEKKVSSTDGHGRVLSSPLYLPRLASLDERTDRIKQALRDRSLEDLGEQIETECLEMHAVMMTTHPSTNYWTEETPEFLVWLRNYRRETGVEAYFTIDAGPNVHVICRQADAERVAHDISNKFPTAQLIEDGVGQGPTLEWKV